MATAEKKKLNFCFHDNHGKLVRLTQDKRTAEKDSQDLEDDDGIVMSEQPMLTDFLYEVRIDEVIADMANIYLGVVTKNPSEYQPLPQDFVNPYPGVFCKTPDFWNEFGALESGHTTEALRTPAVGSRVGLCVDSARSLHLYMDGEDIEILITNVPDVCYFMFDMLTYCVKVTCQPVSCTKCKQSDLDTDHQCQLPIPPAE